MSLEVCRANDVMETPLISAEPQEPTGKTVGTNGLVVVKSNDDLDLDAKRLREAEEKQNKPLITSLASHIASVWEQNREHKETSSVSEEMLRSAKQRDGSYDDIKLAALHSLGGSDVFINLTGVKCRAAESWCQDILSTSGPKPWKLTPTPVPNLADDVEESIVDRAMAEWPANAEAGNPLPSNDVFTIAAQLRDSVEDMLMLDAKEKASRMEDRIWDTMVEGEWDTQFDTFLSDLVTYKAAFIKGPVPRLRNKILWTGNRGKGYRLIPQVGLDVECVSPFNIYPSPGALTVNDGDLIELMSLDRKSLKAMKSVDGYDSDAIDLVLRDHASGLLDRWTSVDEQRATVERTGTRQKRGAYTIQALDYWGSVQGTILKQRGMEVDPDGKKIQDLEEYDVNAILIGSYVVYVAFNDHPLNFRPYFKAVWAKVPGSFWGKGVPELMRDLQDICNAAVRSLVNNAGWASGPQAAVTDLDRVPTGENIKSIFPGKIWQFLNKANSQAEPLKFFQPSSNAAELIAIYEKFSQLADDFTGIPAYAYGNDNVAGAGRTASGLSMLMNSAARGIKKVIFGIDRDVMRPLLKAYHEWFMLYDDDESIKGDMQIQPVGVLGLILREQVATKRMEFLAATNNPTDVQIMGMQRRANVLRATAAALELDANDVVPPDHEIRALELEMRKVMAAQQAQEQAQAA